LLYTPGMERSWWSELVRALRWPVVFLGLTAGLAATGLAVFVGLRTAVALTHPGCGSRVKLALLRARAGRNAIERFVVDHGRCPSSHHALIDERYLDVANLSDPWGTPIAFGCAAPERDTIVTARSAGADRIFGTADDISAD
jgi:hypothetical protein